MNNLAERSKSLPVIGGVSVIAVTLGLLLAGYHHLDLHLPSWVYLGLVWLGTVGGALVNGYWDGGFVVSWFAAAIGVLPMAVAFAPSGPPEIHLALGDVLLKAAGGALTVGFLAGSVSHGIGLAVRRFAPG